VKALLILKREVNNLDDQKIIELYFARDEQAIRETDARYGKLCRRIAYNILRNHEDSEECVNDAYVGIWNAIPPTKPQNLTAFICKIVRNRSLKRLTFLNREKRSADMLVSLDELATILPDERYTPDAKDEDVGHLVSEFLHSQKKEVRNVFIRKYYFFDSIADIANRYGFTESKVKNMLFYARNKLKDFLIKEGIEL
jgi:RNA polymerase sigma-70 factor (ECF subfamily)